MTCFKKVAVALLATMLVAAAAKAQPAHLQPGSALVYPLFDSAPGAGTVICVTNLNDNREYCPDSDFRQGDVLVHYVYIDGETWAEFDRYEMLTPGDTLCVIADQHNPEGEKGFVYVSAMDPNTQTLSSFDYLIGSAIVVQADLNFLWQYTPYSFQSQVSEGDVCERNNPDADGDDDGALDFDGSEYSSFPEELMVDSFFEETGNFTNELTLMTTAGSVYTTEIDFLFWNNIEDKFSRTLGIVCWYSSTLGEISAIASGLGGDRQELGAPPVETGWVSIKGRRVVDAAGNTVDGLYPALLGTFAQFITSEDFAAGHALHYTGSMDGNELLEGDGE